MESDGGRGIEGGVTQPEHESRLVIRTPVPSFSSFFYSYLVFSHTPCECVYAKETKRKRSKEPLESTIISFF